MSELTQEQKDICYEIKFAIIRGVLNLDLNNMWKGIEKAVEKRKGSNRDMIEWLKILDEEITFDALTVDGETKDVHSLIWDVIELLGGEE